MDNDKIYFGQVIWFSAKKGWGFISRKNEKGENMPDLFCYFSDIEAEGFKTLKPNQLVSFKVGKNIRGQDKAVNVKIVK